MVLPEVIGLLTLRARVSKNGHISAQLVVICPSTLGRSKSSMILSHLLNWAAGGPDGFHDLQPVQNDHFWIGVTVTLHAIAVAGFLIIIPRWSKSEKSLKVVHSEIDRSEQ